MKLKGIYGLVDPRTSKIRYIGKGQTSTFKNKKHKIETIVILSNLKKIKIKDQYGNIYESVSDAARILNVRQGSISNVLIGNNKTIKGYKFEYLTKDGNKVVSETKKENE